MVSTDNGWALAIAAAVTWHGSSVLFSQDNPLPTAPSTTGEATSRSSVSEILPPSQWGEDYQIRAFGSEPYIRATFVSYARELRSDFRNLVFRLRIEGEDRIEKPVDYDFWAVPIRIELKGKPDDVYKGDDVRRQVLIGPDNRFSIFVYVKLHDEFEEESFRKEMLAALLIEQMLIPFANSANNLPVDEIEIPSWLTEGFDQMIEHRRNGRPSAFYQGFLESGQLLDPEVILSTEIDDKIDPVSLAMFRASSSALLEALLDQENGDLAMRALLGDFLVTDSAKTDVLLRQHFPALREIDEGLDKWWALQIAALGQQQGYEFLDREETEKFLDEALVLQFDATGTMPRAEPVKKGLLDRLRQKTSAPAATREAFVGTIEDYSQFMDRPDAKEKLVVAFNKLETLKRTGFPAYRPIFLAYESIIQDLKSGKMKTVEEDLKKAAELRAKISETLVQAEDYMNYFEATRAPRRSQAFDDYMEMRRRLENRGRPKREDRISKYLDSLEKEFR